MLVRGEVHLVDLDGGRTVIPVTLRLKMRSAAWTRYASLKSRSVCVSCWSDCPCFGAKHGREDHCVSSCRGPDADVRRQDGSVGPSARRS